MRGLGRGDDMAELTKNKLREMVSKEANRAGMAERQMRDMALEITILRSIIAELESKGDAK